MNTATPDANLRQLFHDIKERLLYLEYARELPVRAQELRTALAALDWGLICRLARRLKTSASLYGFVVLSQCAADLEDQAAHGVADQELAQSIDSLIALSQDVQQQIFDRFEDDYRGRKNTDRILIRNRDYR